MIADTSNGCRWDSEDFTWSASWADCWAAAFGEDCGVWRHSTGDVAFPFERETRLICGVPIRVVRSATNYQSPRFDFWSSENSFRLLGRKILDDLQADMLEFDYVAPDALAYRH